MVTVAEEKREGFLAAYEKVRFNVAATPGHIRDQICQSPDNPDKWLIVSEWDSMAEFFAWEQSTEHKELVRPMQACYSDPEFRSFNVVAETKATRS